MGQMHEIEWLSQLHLQLVPRRAVVGNCQNIQGAGFQQALVLLANIAITLNIPPRQVPSP
jgi:hypothetical protein